MTSTSCALSHGAAICLLWIMGANPSAAGPGDSLPFLLAQAEPAQQAPGAAAEPTEEQDPIASAEPTEEPDPVASAEQAVDEARAALRHAMATGGDVRGARRNLQAAIRHLNEVKTAANEEDEDDRPDDKKTAELPVVDAPSEQTSTTAAPETITPQAPSKALPPLATPQAPVTLPTPPQPSTPATTSEVAGDAGPPADAPAVESPADTSTAALQPQTPPATVAPLAPPAQQQPLPSPPTALPSTDLPTLATPGDAPTATGEPPSSDSQEQPSTQTAEVDPPAQVEQDKSGKRPGFFRRLFGGSEEKVEKPRADDDENEETQEVATVDQSAKPSGEEPEPSLPIFRKLPPLQGPKVVAVTPDAAEVVEEPDEKRVIVKKDGRMRVIHDDNDRFRRKGEDVTVEKGQGGTTVTTVTRGNGDQVITVRAKDGDILQRYRKKRNGEIEMLIGDRDRKGRPRGPVGSGSPGRDRPQPDDVARALPKLVVPIPLNQYIIGSQNSSRSQMQQALIAPPVEPIERAYSLEEIQQSERLRAKLRRIDIDTVNFEFGAATIAEDQVPNLQAIGNALSAIIADDPSQVFFIEGHTDAVGSNRSNLALSDRRAESIAQILTFYFNIPPENLITQGYGEQYLKVLTAGPERRNRRGSVRNITSLLVGQR